VIPAPQSAAFRKNLRRTGGTVQGAGNASKWKFDTMDQIATFQPTGKGAPFTWEEPDESLLEDRRGVLPAFPSGVFPPGLSMWLERASRGAGTLVDHVALPMLGVTSSLIGKVRCIRAISSWVEPMTLWTALIGESGSRKTPGLRAVTRTVDQIEAENKPINLAAEAKHTERVEAARVAMKNWRKDCADAITKWRKDCADAIDKKLEPPKKPDPPKMPIEAVDVGDFIWPSLSVSDCTVPRLARLCMIRPRGMLQIRDELAGLFSNMRAAGSRGFYLESWNGGRYVVERVADDKSFIVENLLVGLVGGFQPDKLVSAFRGNEDGMYSRFLYGWPTTPDYRSLSNDIEEVDPAFKDLLEKLIRLPETNEKGEFAPTIIPLSKGALAEFELYRQFVDRTKRVVEGKEVQWLSKSETHVLRLAGVLTFLAWADASSGTGLESIEAALEPVEINQQFMINAVKLVREYFWPHACAALRQIGLTDRHRNARRVLWWIRSNKESLWNAKNDWHEVSLRDVRREALAHSIDVEETRALVTRLEVAGWLRAEVIQTGGRPRERWTVNPKLFEGAGSAQSAESDDESPLLALPALLAPAKTRRVPGK
jgi:hypothetical protein